VETVIKQYSIQSTTQQHIKDKIQKQTTVCHCHQERCGPSRLNNCHCHHVNSLYFDILLKRMIRLMPTELWSNNHQRNGEDLRNNWVIQHQ